MKEKNSIFELKKNLNNFLDDYIKKKFYSFGINLERNIKKDELLNFIERFKKNYISIDLVRIGGDGDGGYLVPKIIDKMKSCFSAGVGDIINFEKELSEKYEIKSFMADASVNSLPQKDKNFKFFRKYLSSINDDNHITLRDWLKLYDHENNQDLILQMDIESSEYEVLSFENENILSKFSIMVIEFHKFQNLCNPIFYKFTNSIFEKIYKNFFICHVHPNNYSGLYYLKGIPIPSCLEITFIRKDLLNLCKIDQKINLPHKLDSDNCNKSPKLIMPNIWWQK